MERNKFCQKLLELRNKHMNLGSYCNDIHMYFNIEEDKYWVISQDDYAKLLGVTYGLGMIDQYLYGGIPSWPIELKDEYEYIAPLMQKIIDERKKKDAD